MLLKLVSVSKIVRELTQLFIFHIIYFCCPGVSHKIYVWITKINYAIRCPTGLKMSNNQCVNENECLWFPCQNGGRCKDHSPPRKYECNCPLGFTGMHCELELLASGVLSPSKDFIIALIICAGSLIRK